MLKKTITVHTLVKNEAKFLWYSVTSIIDYVDNVLLWDTGSTDESLDIEKELQEKYPNKISIKYRKQSTAEDFANVRQEMLDATSSDWFIMVDADEIWWEESIQALQGEIYRSGDTLEAIVVPTVNPVGDIFHRQDERAGRYKLAGRIGHYNLRAINRRIPGLHSSGRHGVWGWVDSEDRMIQDRDPAKIGYLDAPYLHTTYLERAGKGKDSEVIKRKMKMKHEIGDLFPKDFYYPEVFFRPRPDIVECPWKVMDANFKLISYLETPLRKLKRRLWWGRAGY